MQTLVLVKEHAHRDYPQLSGLIPPRPIVFITTFNPQGKVNTDPFISSPIGQKAAPQCYCRTQTPFIRKAPNKQGTYTSHNTPHPTLYE